jgi:hypothetical protein
LTKTAIEKGRPRRAVVSFPKEGDRRGESVCMCGLSGYRWGGVRRVAEVVACSCAESLRLGTRGPGNA